MTPEEMKKMIDISKKFYDTIDFWRFIVPGTSIELKKLIYWLETYYGYNHPELLPEEFHGNFLNFIDDSEFAEYLCERYGWRIETEVIEKTCLYTYDKQVS